MTYGAEYTRYLFTLLELNDMLRRMLIAALLSVVVVHGMAESIPEQLKSARTVFILNDTGDPSVLQMAQHFFVGSRFTCVEDRRRADLVLKFGRIFTANDPAVMGHQISISVRNIFTLEVFNRRGARLWVDSAELLDDGKTHRRPHPARHLLNEFLDVSAHR